MSKRKSVYFASRKGPRGLEIIRDMETSVTNAYDVLQDSRHPREKPPFKAERLIQTSRKLKSPINICVKKTTNTPIIHSVY
jgi:hypothetical protein